MKGLVVAFALFFSVMGSLHAQYVRPVSNVPQPTPGQAPGTPPPSAYNFWDHTSVGGNFSLLFGDLTYVVVAPLFNYHISQNFEIGIGPFYQYYSLTEAGSNYNSSIYGGRVVGMCFLPDRLNNIFVQAEYDVLDVPDQYTYTNDTRTSVGVPLVGAGYRQPAGPRSYFTISILFDLSNSPLSPYYSGSSNPFPVVFAGVDIGL